MSRKNRGRDGASPSLDELDLQRPGDLRRSSEVPTSAAGLIEQVARDLVAHRWLAARGDPLAQGAALAAAHGVLALATAPLASRRDRELRRAALDEARPILAQVGLGHVAGLAAAALDLEMHPVTLERMIGRQ